MGLEEEYLFENRVYGIASKNFKAYFMDVVAEIQRENTALQEVMGTVDEGTKAGLQEMITNRDDFLKELVNFSGALFEGLKGLDAYSRETTLILSGEKVGEQVNPEITDQNAASSGDATQGQAANSDGEAKAENEAATPLIIPTGDAQTEQTPTPTEGETLIPLDETNTSTSGELIPLNTANANAAPAEGEAVGGDDAAKNVEGSQLVIPLNEGVSSTPVIEPTGTGAVDKPLIPMDDIKVEAASEESTPLIPNVATTVVGGSAIDTKANSSEGASLIQADTSVQTGDNAVIDLPPVPSAGEQDNVIAADTGASATSTAELNAPVEDTNKTEDGTVVVGVSPLLFIKKTDDETKAIMTNNMQITKLRASRHTQEELLKGLGFLDENSVGELNAMLDSQANDAQQQVDALMEQANQLYAAGNIEEAQRIFDQISVYSQSVKAGSSK